jgi:uncharacterized protein involved in exopolysaccharide biosynthesis/Mrp family chromosome partitioning ATPase
MTPDASENLPLARMASTLYHRRWQFLACLLLVCGIALVSIFRQTPIYESTTRVQVILDDPKVVYSNLGSDYFSTQVELLQSRRVMKHAARIITKSPLWKNDSKIDADQLRDLVGINVVAKSRLIDIVGMSHKSGQQAALISESVADAFIEISDNDRNLRISRFIDWTGSQNERYDKEIATKKNELNAFRQKHFVAETQTSHEAVEKRVGNIERELTDLRIKQVKLDTQRQALDAALDNVDRSPLSPSLIEDVDDHDEVRYQRLKITQLYQLKDKYERIYLPGHPKLKDLNNQIEGGEALLVHTSRQLIGDVRDRLQFNYENAVKEEGSLLVLLDREKHTGSRLAANNQDYDELQRELQLAYSLKEKGVTHLGDFVFKAGTLETPVVVVDDAQAPSAPVHMRKLQRALSVLLLGLLFSVAFILALDRLQRFGVSAGLPESPAFDPAAEAVATVAEATPEPQDAAMSYANSGAGDVTQDQIEEIELDPGYYERLAFTAKCRIVHLDQASGQAATFREAGMQLLGRFGRSKQAVAVSGLQDGSGKTICASNIAISIANAGRKVLLVDANFRSPGLRLAFPECESSSDFQSFLNEPDGLADVAPLADITNLTVVPCQKSGDARAIDPDKLAAFNVEAFAHYDWVIYDTGSLSQPDAATLLPHVGKCLCVVRSSENKETLQQEIERHGAVCIGYVANDYEPVEKSSRLS